MPTNNVTVLRSALQEHLADIMYSIDYGYTASILSKRYEGTCAMTPSINWKNPKNVGLLEYYNTSTKCQVYSVPASYLSV